MIDQIRNLILKLLYLLPPEIVEGTVLNTFLQLVIILIAVGVVELLLRLLFLKTLPQLLSKIKGLQFADGDTLHKVVANIIRIVSIQIFKGLLSVPFPHPGSFLYVLLVKVIAIYTVILIVQAIGFLLTASRSWMLTSGKYRNNPMVNLFEVIRIVIYFIAGLYIVSILFSVDMNKVFGSLAALSAVLMLVFKDTIMGVVASIQLSGNDMLRVGDWITVPKYGVDGSVIDISLTTVKLRNFDNTISTIPPYSLISETFQNWRFMEQSGGRRIQRSVNIDLKTIHFVDRVFVDHLKASPLVDKYIDEITRDYTPHVSERLTNIGLLRKYVEAYLSDLKVVHKDFTCLVHTKASTEQGIPLELYFFTKATDYVTYEAVASEVFDHVIAIVPYFDLAIFQKVSGNNAVFIAPKSEENSDDSQETGGAETLDSNRKA